MRELTSHKIDGCNEAITVSAADEPGIGAACHVYRLDVTELSGQRVQHSLFFQNGAISEVGVNGITNEALLAIVADRLEGFQSGPFACRENALALTKLQEAMHWLHHRTRARMERGVEGTHQV